MAYGNRKSIIGVIQYAAPRKEGKDLPLKVLINDRQFVAWDATYISKKGVESEWFYTTREREWNGKKIIEDVLEDLVPKGYRPQYPKKEFVPGFSKARSQHTIDEVYDLVAEIKAMLIEEEPKVLEFPEEPNI